METKKKAGEGQEEKRDPNERLGEIESKLRFAKRETVRLDLAPSSYLSSRASAYPWA